MNCLTSKTFITNTTAGRALVKPITTPKHEYDHNPDTFTPSMTEGTRLLVADVNREGREVEFGTGFRTGSKFTTENFIDRTNDFKNVVRLDQSSKDLNENGGQVEVNYPSEGWGRQREHYLLANYDGFPTQGWMETHESYPATESQPAFDRRTFTSSDNGRIEYSRVEMHPDGSFGVAQYISDMRHPEESSQTFWLTK